MRILVIDDQLELLKATGQVLEFLGFVPVLAHGGRAALAKLQVEEFDIVLSDVQMPGLTGPELYLSLQEKEFGTFPRFIFMSGSATRETLAGELGFENVELLRKPFNIKSLKAALQSAKEKKGA